MRRFERQNGITRGLFKTSRPKSPEKKPKPSGFDLWMAGAEGIEPSARGFGVDVGKNLHHNAFRLFQPLADFRQFAPLRFDAFLMLFAYELRLPTWICQRRKRYEAEHPKVLKIYIRENKE